MQSILKNSIQSTKLKLAFKHPTPLNRSFVTLPKPSLKKNYPSVTLNTTPDEKLVSISFPNGSQTSFHGIWLRDHCRCQQCFHPITKQRLLDTSKISLDAIPTSTKINESNELHVQWDDGHQSVYPLTWLEKNSYYPDIARKIEDREVKLWGSNLINQLPITPYREIMDSDEGLKKWLTNIDSFGLGFVSDVPKNLEDTKKLAERITFVRETHYGGFWDFTADLAHGDTAYTNIALPAHTDTTYFTDPIGLQFFHLVHHEGTGGESLYVDGFNVALQLKEENPEAFKSLTEILISAHSAGDANTLIQPTPLFFPIIKLDPTTGHLQQIRFNNDDRSILKQSKPQKILEFYSALQEWTRILRKPENELWVKLKPGTAVIMDNWRTMHGRASFTGTRRMIGSYHNWDDYRSRKRTKKVGVTGKYGTRYGASLRKQVKKMEITQHAKYTCTFCGKDSVKRTAVGIWKCKGCSKVLAGGAWTVSTTAASTVRSTIRRLRELNEA
ncbi:hypothetical protein BC833DRAFT_622997 [Globomyces pollinis-pini]|nr:hypothetical protein BC833DRAFT_622997 [Globomyces pollinis-pini]